MKIKKKVAFYTLGCKLNFSETSTIARMFPEDDFQKVEFEDIADIYVINTCSVTDNADKKCKAVARQALKRASGAFIAVIGCFAQLKPEAIASIPGVDIVLGTSEKFNLLSYYNDSAKSGFKAEIHVQEIKHCNSFVSSYSAGDRTRSFLKIQDGCDYFCSFCTIPLARGRSRSDSIVGTIASAKKAIATGIKEIILTGVNIGDFGNNGKRKMTEGKWMNEETFLDLIRQLDALDDIERIRISSIEPNLLTDEIIEFVASSQHFMPHFHIPLQSGCNKILKAMKRKYEKELYEERITKIKSLLPNCCIGVDVIAGFPGESEDDFTESYHFINRLDISYLHVFTYSERTDTLAARLPDAVPPEIKHQRSKILHILSEKKKRAFYEQHENSIAEVLFEKENNDQMMYGFTENYIKVQAPYDSTLCNTIKKVMLTEIQDSIFNIEPV